ncbi:hypothetical protein FHX74_002066 [Friedmanniella endophytica]|uniref:SPOR domain-containing protein n=1 Tax=Microlunatus kandeliicorticis TaxID=1759536 RepID=A0A7W3ISJ1_9ACTN|nr:SPOR domain-containing protein [Microlunatus kandeliicorticis]MBA8794447.1 hypothetical protein [Microlunatus kandeliicorticis]
MSDGQWWFNLKTHSVESDEDRGKAADRLGPYATREEAEHAMEKVAARNEEADREDRWPDEDD